MGTEITLPFWLFLLLVCFAGLLVLDRILLPGARWYLRRRVNRVLDEINTRLQMEIRPFQQTQKQALVEQLVYDEKVMEAMKAYAAEHNMPKEVAQAKVTEYAQEIAPTFNAYVYFRFGYWLAKGIARLMYRIRVGFHDAGQLRKVPHDASVVFVMNHRSNMDYVLVSFLAAERTALSYAVGEWARIWPLQSLIKAMGAFFVRRNSNNALYRKVLERYVNLATRAGVCQAVFLEGGLTRDGALRDPKLGFLDYMLRDYHPGVDRDVVFVPVGINYDRVAEDRSLVRTLDPEAERRSTWFVIKTTLSFTFKHLMMPRRKRWRRFGYASVNFGKPLNAREFCESHFEQCDMSQLDKDDRIGCVQQLADELMSEVAKIVPVLPVALVAETMLSLDGQPTSELEIKARAVQRIEELKQLGAPIDISETVTEGVLMSALDMLSGRGLIDWDHGLYAVNPDEIDMLEYYANSIASWRTLSPPASPAS